MASPTARRSRHPLSATKGDVKEQTLLHAARRLLAAGRFVDVSVSEIAGEAGLSRASFYFYFASKQALLGAVVTEAVQEFSVRLADDLANHDGLRPAELVATTVQGAADLWCEHRAAMVASFDLGVALPDVYNQNLANIALVREPTVRLLLVHGDVPEASNRQETEALVTSLIMMTERNFYDLARRDAPRGEYDTLIATLSLIWQRAFGIASTER